MSNKLTREAIWWCLALAILLWLTLIERLPLTSIGFCRPTWKTVAFAVLAAIAVTAVMVIEFAVIIPMLHLSRDVIIAKQQEILRTPYWYRVLLVLRAAVVEEIIYRGYMIEKVRQLTGSAALAVIVSVAVFAFAHLRGWGPSHLLATADSGAIFSLIYIRLRDLPSNILAHFLTDATAFLTR